MNFPGRLIAGFMVVILIFVFPLQYIAGSNSENIDSLVDGRTKKLSDDIREKGYIDKPMYEGYVDYLDITGEMYDIEIQDINPVRGEELASSSSEIKNISNNLMLSSDNKSINTSLLSTNEIQSFATHTHTDACYAGDLHVCDGASCEYSNDYKTEILLLTQVATQRYYGDDDRYYTNFLYSNDGGQTWVRNSAGLPRYGNKRMTYGPDGYYYVLDDLTFDYINYYTQVAKYDPSTNTKTIIDPGSSIYNTNYNGIIYRNDKYFILPQGAETRLLYSLNGKDIKGTLGIPQGLYIDNIAYGNDVYATVCRDFYNYRTGIYTSEDGINWTLRKSLDNAGEIIFVGDRFIYGDNEGYLHYSFNGINWVNIGKVEGFNEQKRYQECKDIKSMAYGNNTLLVSDSYNIYIIKNFNMGRNNIDVSTYFNNNKLHFNDGYFYIGDTGPSLRKSIDGITWTTINLPEFPSKSDYYYFFENVYSIVFNSIGDTGKVDKGPCLKEGKHYDNNGNEVTPICNQVVTSITATSLIQTVKKGQPIITTATATYLDGHTGIVSCTSNYNPNLVGVQTVTLTYRGLVGNAKTTGTRTCTVSVTVQPDKSLTSLTVTPATQTIQKYSMPSFVVRATYSDGTNQILNTSQYTITGLDVSKIGLQSVTISYTESGITKNALVSVTVTNIMKECPRCHSYYELNSDDTDPGCPYCVDIVVGIEVAPAYVEVTKGSSLPITVIAKYMDGTESEISGWVSNYNPERLGLQIVTIEYRGYGKDITVWVNDEVTTCPICNIDYPKSESACPVCSEKVVSIDVSPDEITVMQYETIALTVTAFYADGSSREVDDWSIDTATGKPGTYNATVSYKGVKDTVKLNIISINSIECPICHTIYDVIESPSGCPICSKEIIGIEAYLTSGSNLVQYGSNPNIVIILVFRDDHREFGYEKYIIENYNPQKLGIQTITVIYKGFTTTMVIEVVNMVNEIICPNGHIYHSNTDGSDPGCPYCHTGEEVSKIAYFDITYTSKILDTIYLEGRYHFTKGNYVSIIVIKKDKSLLYKMQNTFFSTSILGRKRRYIHGGEVY